jgi:homocysteine S-methyltransferase
MTEDQRPAGRRASPLPQLDGQMFVTDGGMETDLIFHHGVDLPCFAAFPLLDTAAGRDLLTSYYDGYAAIAEHAKVGLLLESPTWRASSDWGERLGYTGSDLARINGAAITMLAGLRERYSLAVPDVLISGMVGPRRDGYSQQARMDQAEAAAYHRPQAEAFAEAGADMLTALTLTDPDEAIGVSEAARAAGLPAAISFTLETDGSLPSGGTLAQAIRDVDAAARPEYFLVNCAHPTHIAPALAEPGPWRERIAGLRYNASAKSHAELDEAEDLDEGDPALIASVHRQLRDLLPGLAVVGGCCGTDTRHVAALWDVEPPA